MSPLEIIGEGFHGEYSAGKESENAIDKNRWLFEKGNSGDKATIKKRKKDDNEEIDEFDVDIEYVSVSNQSELDYTDNKK